MKYTILEANERYIKQEYKKEDELEEIFGKYYRQIVSEKSFWVPLKKQLKSKRKNFNHSIGDGFLVVWDNPTTPTLYITEVELGTHDVDKHILPQLGNFISFIQSSTTEQLNDVRNLLYDEVKKDNEIFNKIKQDTDEEVYKLIDNSTEDLQILLVIDEVSAELSIGLSQIEKAINVKIRKIEVSKFLSEEGEEVILFSDSEAIEVEKEEIEPEIDEYTIDYHLENKPEKIKRIVNEFLKYAKDKKVDISCMKHYIGFYKNEKMIFSCVVRKNSVVFYSKETIEDIKNEYLQMRDVRNIGHYTNHLPTEIVITDFEQIDRLKKYFDEVYIKF
jgi:predicted transport protein